jgi:hypothetical protein
VPTRPDAASTTHVARVPTYTNNWHGISGILYAEPLLSNGHKREPRISYAQWGLPLYLTCTKRG